MIRMSSIARRLQCPQFGAPQPTDITINGGDSPAAIEGTAAHEAMAIFIETGRMPDLRLIAEKYEIPNGSRDALYAGVNFAVKTWEQDLGRFFPNPRTEVQVTSETLSKLLGEPVVGHVDVLSILPERCGAILDFKFGRGDSDYWGNMMAYGLAVCEQYDLDHITLSVMHLRLNTIDTRAYHRTELEAWAENTVKPRIIDEATHYNPSSACTYCQRKMNCPARRAIIASTADTLVSVADDSNPGRSMFPDLYDPERRAEAGPMVVQLLDRIKLITDALETVRAELKQNLRDFGPIPLGDGRAYGINIQQRKDLDASKALDHLRDFGATDAEILSAMSLSYSQIENILAKRAIKEQGRGAGKTTREKLLQYLIDQGSLTLREIEVAQKIRADAATSA